MPQKPNQDERLDESLPRHDKLSELIRDLMIDMKEFTTVLKLHIGEQRSINSKLDDLVADHENRLKLLEEYRAVMKATLPDKILNPAYVESQIKNLANEQAKQKNEQNLIREKLLRNTLILGAIVGVALWALSVLIPALFNHFFHIGA